MIQKIPGVITKITDLTPTAREYTIALSSPLSFVAGNFVNLFVPHEGKSIRRAFSISSSDAVSDSISLSVRLSPQGVLTPILWEKDFLNTPVEIMGPLGIHTADKITTSRVFLFGFGIGAGVIKSVAERVVHNTHTTALTIMTGNRSDTEIVHKDYFDALQKEHRAVTVRYIISSPAPDSPNLPGYIQDHLKGYDFNNADVYVCGQTVACDTLVKTIEVTSPINCRFFVEAFH